MQHSSQATLEDKLRLTIMQTLSLPEHQKPQLQLQMTKTLTPRHPLIQQLTQPNYAQKN